MKDDGSLDLVSASRSSVAPSPVRALSAPGVRLTSKRVLAIDDDADMCELLRDALGARGFQVETATTSAAGLAMLRASRFDAIVADVRLEDESGVSLCRQIIREDEDMPVVLITAFDDLDTAIQALRAGAEDFIPKPLNLDMISISLHRALQRRALRREVRHLSYAVEQAQPVTGLVGESKQMRRAIDLIDRVAPGDATVLVTGESGTGKELVARAVHAASGRASGPFLALNCAAMPSSLLESELFGHTAGAFTGAKKAKRGLFVATTGGTLFLDEIAEMSPEMQAKLLRVLQERKVRPVGGNTEIAFDTRIIAATNRNLEKAVEEGQVRQDLYYRINVVNIEIPPLRSRATDVLLLAQHFLQRAASRTSRNVQRISSATAEKLLAYDWPGNVRELENTIERAVALTAFENITPEDLPEKIRDHGSTRMIISGDNPTELPTLEEMEGRYIRYVLEATAGNKSHAARVLGVHRRGLYRKLRRLGQDVGVERE